MSHKRIDQTCTVCGAQRVQWGQKTKIWQCPKCNIRKKLEKRKDPKERPLILAKERLRRERPENKVKAEVIRAERMTDPEKHEKLKAAWRKYNATEAGLERMRRAYYNATEEEKRAHVTVRAAVELGQIVPPEVCSACGSGGRMEAHHHLGYKQEHWLDVVWLCRPCHAKVDKGSRRQWPAQPDGLPIEEEGPSEP